ncbi:MAG TPA: hypothetical protein VNV86_12025 [Candidatus Acidoferrum sp.]|jgi:hypothetical protein|nr:hypothetical protein [Candidatus Acidoferrum sp.]
MAAPSTPTRTVLADRYRIVALLGKGGMGEVYRANDLKLAQPVAMKFLPSNDLRMIERFRSEVGIARQVSHPNVCRVYDIGEDLASLLCRIGRLPHDKALEIARKLCAGLAALTRFGLLPLIIGILVSTILPGFPMILDFSAWYSGSTMMAIAAVLALAGFAFHIARTGRTT